jgi:sialic acid synthase SpsE/sugar phosphate isomerase/epimerase
MFKIRNIEPFLVLSNDSVHQTLVKITTNKSSIAIVVDNSKHLLGVVTNGDILRWMAREVNPNLNISINKIQNKNFLFATESSTESEIRTLLRKVQYIPVINELNQVVSVYSNKPSTHFQIGKTLIGEGHPVYVIAEIGINHNGDYETAKKLIDKAAESGADAVKIQLRDLETVYTKKVLEDSLTAEHSTQYLLYELKSCDLDFSTIEKLHQKTQNLGIDFLVTPFDIKSAELLKQLDLPAFKIGSPDFTNLPLIENLAAHNKPLILSTGMSTEAEIDQVIQHLNSLEAQYSLLHCNSTYPASIEDLNLNFIKRLALLSKRTVGYSGHEKGFIPTLAAVTLGAKIIERHITLSCSAIGPDHSSSLEPIEFSEMVKSIRLTEKSLGRNERILNQGEQGNRIALGKSLVASNDLPKGKILTKYDLISKSPAKGISALHLDKLVGKKLVRNLAKEEFIQFEDVNHTTIQDNVFKIDKKWGIVGRLNDFDEYLDWKPKLVEIHLTWRDLTNTDLNKFVKKYDGIESELVVHAPEYFEDKLIDFATDQIGVLDYSFEMLERTIELSRKLSPIFKGTDQNKGPKIVVHPGGHFEFLKETNRSDQYKLLLKHLTSIDSEGVELLVENMPPNPWYFGGQWYNTIFLDSAEILQFSKESNLNVCFDTSHALLYCNHANVSLDSFAKDLSESVRHLHISDGAGTTQEGLQLGEGDLDFEHLFKILNSIDSGFVPEIWQGHLNNGKGFRTALLKIEKLLMEKMSTKGCH